MPTTWCAPQFPVGVFLRITSGAYLPRVQQRRRSGRRGRWSGAQAGAWRWIGQLLKGEVYYQLRLGN